MEAPRWHDPRLLQTRTLDTPVAPPRWADRPAWEARARVLRTRILAATGLWADPGDEARQPPAAEVFERLERPELGYSVEKVHFESLPGCLVTGNLYRPLPAGGARRPAILNPHGHWAEGRLHHSALGSTAMRCITFARMGYVAFCHDMAGYGDNLRLPHRWGGPAEWLWGATPLGLQLWNCIRSLDFLAALPDVDPARLGCTGESGGGTQTFLLTAVDARVRAAAPVNMVSAHMQGGCICENAPGLRLNTSNIEIAALCAPRPMLLVSATGDWTANTPRVEFPAIAAIYALHGARDRVSTVQVDAPHNYNRASREAVYPFFARWLPADGGPVPSEDDIPGPDADDEIRVFARRPWPACPEGDAAAAAVTAWYRARAERALEARPPGGGRETLLAHLLAVAGVEPVAAGAVSAAADGDTVWLGRRGHAERFAARRGDLGAPVRLRAADGAEWGVWPFATGADGGPWGRSGRASAADFFLCYNRADAAWQAQDLLTAAAWLGAGRPLARLQAGGACAVAAVLARAVLGAAVTELDVELGPEWAAEAPEAPWLQPHHHLPGALRAGGLPGLLALAAPARVRIRCCGAPAALAAVRAAYAALGAAAACIVE